MISKPFFGASILIFNLSIFHVFRELKQNTKDFQLKSSANRMQRETRIRVLLVGIWLLSSIMLLFVNKSFFEQTFFHWVLFLTCFQYFTWNGFTWMRSCGMKKFATFKHFLTDSQKKFSLNSTRLIVYLTLKNVETNTKRKFFFNFSFTIVREKIIEIITSEENSKFFYFFHHLLKFHLGNFFF